MRSETVSALIEALTAEGIRTEKDVPLSAHTTFRIGGAAALGAFPENADALCRACALCRDADVPYTVLGFGSDILADDAGYAGCIIFTGGCRSYSLGADGHVYADCGASLTALARAACNAGLAGLAFACGIPGSVGGAVFMNAGAYDGEIGQAVTSVRCLDTESGEIRVFGREDCAFAYRDSVFQHTGYIILSAEFTLSQGDAAALCAEADDYLRRRREKQPLEYPSAGSVFKRCPGFYTARLIDEAGFKGYSVGGAQVSEKHAGFIVNRGGATAEDVRTLVRLIKEKIYALHGIRIECEIRELHS